MATKATKQKSGSKKKTTAKKNVKKNTAAQEITGFALIVTGIFAMVAVLMGGAGLLGRGMATVMFGLFGMDFTGGQAIAAIFVAVLSSVAMSGIPGGGGTGELVLCTIFFPEQLAIAYPFALALGNLIDPPATMVNAAGDYVSTFIVSRFVDGKDWLQKQMNK